MISTSNSFTIDDICKLIGIDTPEQYLEKNIDSCRCHSKGNEVYDYNIKDYVIAEEDYICDICSFDYPGKVRNFFKELLGNFFLDLVEKDDYTYEVAPTRNWYVVACKLIETINGEGMFHFYSVLSAIRSGPYEGSKGFCVNHIHYVPEYTNVFEGTKANSYFERKYMR